MDESPSPPPKFFFLLRKTDRPKDKIMDLSCPPPMIRLLAVILDAKSLGKNEIMIAKQMVLKTELSTWYMYS